MNLLAKPVVRILLVLAVAVGAWMSFQSVYLTPRAAIEADLTTTRNSIAVLRGVLKEVEDTRTRRKQAGALLLGTKLDVVSARFRDGLTRVGETAGLEKVVVEHGQPQDVASPVLDAKGVATDLKRQLRRQADFQVLRGSVRGTGTLAQAVSAIGMLQQQPWVHRVEAFTLRPVGKARETFELRVDVATIYSPELAAEAPTSTPELTPASAESESTWRAIASRNAFKAPGEARHGDAPPIITVAAAPGPGQSSVPPPRPFAPYEDWKLTGVASGRSGLHALFVNLKTGDRLTVLRGGQVLDAVLIDGEGEHAVVEIAGQRFDVSVGNTLAARKPQG